MMVPRRLQARVRRATGIHRAASRLHEAARPSRGQSWRVLPTHMTGRAHPRQRRFCRSRLGRQERRFPPHNKRRQAQHTSGKRIGQERRLARIRGMVSEAPKSAFGPLLFLAPSNGWRSAARPQSSSPRSGTPGLPLASAAALCSAAQPRFSIKRSATPRSLSWSAPGRPILTVCRLAR